MKNDCPSCSTINRDKARYCKRCGVPLVSSNAESMDDLVGMLDIRREIARLAMAMDNNMRRSGLTYSDRLHSILIGNAGTGKTRLVYVLAALFHRFGITKASTPIICDAVDYADFSKNFQDNFQKAKGHVLCIENVQKLIPAGYAKNVEPIDRLIREMSKPANNVDPIIVLSGQPQGLREFLGANDDVRNKFPYVFRLPDFTSSELAELTIAELGKGGFNLSDAAKNKLIRVFKLLLKKSRMPGFEPDGRNAWAAVKMAETLKINYLVSNDSSQSGAQTISDEQILGDTDDEKPIEEILAELDKFVGMRTLKQAVRNLIDEISVQRQRFQAGVGRQKAISFHIVLTGNPGTGKTTVARILGQTLRAIGVLELGHVIEVDRSKLVAPYVGQTALLVNDLCDRAMGGMLFIDEAYALKQSDDDTFGQEAIDTLLKRMEDDRGNFVVVIAGYPKEIGALLNSNPGLQSRFDDRYRFNLDDYMPAELLSIFQKMAADENYHLDTDAEQLVTKHFTMRCSMKDKNFGNGREVRQLFEASRSMLARRIAKQTCGGNLDDVDLTLICGSDIPLLVGPQLKDIPTVLTEINRLIGLKSVKGELRKLIEFTQIEMLRGERGGNGTQLNLHFVFRGNPGTGKTTVARIIGDVLKALGLLANGNLTEVGRAELVGTHVGQTAPKVNAVIDGAMGGILFIDEAYSLLGDSFGNEAITELLKRMDNDRGKFCVIAAGYFREMDEFLNANSGFRSRFTKFIDFEDYRPDELKAIYLDMISRKGMVLCKEAEAWVADLFENIYAKRDRSFANGRDVRNIFEQTLQNQAARLAPLLQSGAVESNMLNTIISADISL